MHVCTKAVLGNFSKTGNNVTTYYTSDYCDNAPDSLTFRFEKK